MKEMFFRQELLKLKDEKYKEFNRKLIPTIDPEKIIGVRVPQLRKLAKYLSKNHGEEVSNFLKEVPHHYFEENNLHILLIEEIKDFDEVIVQTEFFLPYIDNWQTCDLFSPKIFKKNPRQILEKIPIWMKSDHIYTVRFAIGLLLSNYLKENFEPRFFDWILAVKSEEYYIKMMVAWYFSMALVHQYQSALEVLQSHQLDSWTHNKTIQKAMESRRIPNEQKIFLKTLRV